MKANFQIQTFSDPRHRPPDERARDSFQMNQETNVQKMQRNSTVFN